MFSYSEEFIEIQKCLLSGEMSHTDLNNWFFDFCDRIGCGVDESPYIWEESPQTEQESPQTEQESPQTEQKT